MKICPTCGRTHNWFPVLQRISPDDLEDCSRAPFDGASAAVVSFALSDSTQFRHSRELSRSRGSRDPPNTPQHPPDPSEGADIPANQQGGEGSAAPPQSASSVISARPPRTTFVATPPPQF
jgi:hypothetical protein